MIFQLDDGKQVTLSSDPRHTGIWLQVLANRGSLGLELTPETAKDIAVELFYLARRMRKVRGDA